MRKASAKHRSAVARLALLIGLLALSVASAPSMAADKANGVTATDYERADRIRSLDPLSIGGRVFPHWFGDGLRFTYRSYGLHERPGVPVLVDPLHGTKRPLFDPAKIAGSLSQLTGKTVAPGAWPEWGVSSDGRFIAINSGGAAFRCEILFSTCRRATAKEQAEVAASAVPDWAVRSPDGKWDAFVWNHNVYIRPAGADRNGVAALPRSPKLAGNNRFGADLEDGIGAFRATGVRSGCDFGAPFAAPAGQLPRFEAAPTGSVALTRDGNTEWSFSPRAIAGAEISALDNDRYKPTRGMLAWSPDSRRIIARREDIRGVGIYPLYSSTGVQPVDHSYYYAKPGDKAVPVYDLYILDIAARASVKVDLPPTGAVLAPGGAEWGRDSRSLYVLTSSRGAKEVRLSLVDAATGAAQPIITERSKTFVEMSNGDDENIVAIANDGEDIFWFSERDGWGHLYRYDRRGELKNQVESGDYSVAELIRIDSAAQQLYFTAWGKAPGIPYYRHLYRVNFDGSGLTHLTPEPGDHLIQWMPAGGYFLDTMSAIDRPPVTALRRADGRVVTTLSTGRDDALREIGWRAAEPFTVKARDGKTDLYGVMYKPSHFDPAKKYPIITNLYPGPFKGSVGRTWSFQGPDNYEVSGEGGQRPTHGEGLGQSLAELGFIIIKLDAMGTARRSKAFQDHFWGRTLDNGLPDQIAAIKQLGARHPWIDTDRVGITGHSGGGYAAAAGMLLYPETFKVGVAQSGNHDSRTYGWYWGEKYQGLLENEADARSYEAQATYNYADRLRGRLFLMHGDMDCNTPPAETLRLADALTKAEKDFDLLIVPDAGHQLPAYTMRRSWDYFVQYLAGGDPPKDYKLQTR